MQQNIESKKERFILLIGGFLAYWSDNFLIQTRFRGQKFFKKINLFFLRYEDTKISLWDYLTFRDVVVHWRGMPFEKRCGLGFFPRNSI